MLAMPSFYIGALMLALGIEVTFASQRYLHDYVTEVRTLPVLSDMILDNLPYLDISWLYDLFSLVAFFVFCAYTIHRRQFSRVPYALLLCGMFHLMRGVFIVLNPFGNPPMFHGTEGLFNGFSNFEFGVYPSGHTGINFLYFLLAADERYRAALLICTCVVIVRCFYRGALQYRCIIGSVFRLCDQGFRRQTPFGLDPALAPGPSMKERG